MLVNSLNKKYFFIFIGKILVEIFLCYIFLNYLKRKSLSSNIFSHNMICFAREQEPPIAFGVEGFCFNYMPSCKCYTFILFTLLEMGILETGTRETNGLFSSAGF